MKKIIFKASSQKDFSIATLMKEINKVSCRILFDLEHGMIVVENVDTSTIDYIIDLINKYYTISSVDIDNTIETVKKDDGVSDIKEQKTEKNLNFKNIEFENKYIETLINKLSKTVSFALSTNNATEKEIGEFILTCISELSLTYNQVDCIEFNVGDVVDCNYGTHLHGEINGIHVPAIVCHILNNGMAYLVPITKTIYASTSNSILQFKCPENIIYDNPNFTGGSALLNKAKYLRPERFHRVVGRVTPDFFETILNRLPSVFDFTNHSSNLNCTTSNTNQIDDTISSSKNSPVKISRISSTKTFTEESELLEIFSPVFDKLDNTKKLEDLVDDFFNEIGLITTSEFVKQCFIIACSTDKKINYENILLELQNMNTYITNITPVKVSLKGDFKNWLKKYPDLANKCPRISLMSILKVFAKKFA